MLLILAPQAVGQLPGDQQIVGRHLLAHERLHLGGGR